MKQISQHRWTRTSIMMLLAAIGTLEGCQSASPPADDDADNVLSDQEVADAMRELHPLMSDIPPIPIPEELASYQGPGLQEALDVINTINGFTASDVFSASSAKLGLVKRGDGEWVEQISDPTQMVVTYTKTDGDLTTTVTHMLGVPGQWVWWVEWDGCDGKNRYDHFTVDFWLLTKDLKYMKHDRFQCLDAPSCDSETGCHESTPMMTWVFEVEGEATLYTPWGQSHLVTRKYTTTSYAYSAKAGGFGPFTVNVCTSYPDGRLIFEHWTRRLSDDLLYKWYVGIFTADHRYCWTTYRENGTVLDCGGDMGCPDCGP